MTRRHVHMIGHAHIDPVWLWHWPEGYQEVRATFSAALDRMEEYPDFVFTMDQVVFLTWIAEHDRPLFERIRARVTQGRWEIAGAMWVEPDCNLPSGESLARHLLYSQRYLLAEFGRPATVGLNADPFGHTVFLPQLLAAAGIDSYLFLRPQAHEQTLPLGPFWWTAPDGSRVLATRIPNEYCSPPGEVTHVVAKALAQSPAGDTPLICFYGVGNHGGGPTRANIESIGRLAARDGLPALGMSSARAYVDAVLADPDDLPEVRGELQPHAVGCYSAVSEVKRGNRRVENLLAGAEKWAALARAVDPDAPDVRADLEQAWKALLFTQFHDVLPGTALPETYVDARDQHGLAATLAGRIANRAVQSLSRRIDIPFSADAFPVVVFNPHGFGVSELVETESNAAAGPFTLTDDAGRDVPLQAVRSRSLTAGRGRLAFRAEVPAFGYRLFRLRTATVGPAPDPDPADPFVLDNGRVRARIDPGSGWLAELRAAGGPSVVDPDRPHAVVLTDDTDTWSHGVRSFRAVAGAFRPVRVQRTESGPVRQAVRVVSEYGRSTLVEDIGLAAGADHLEVAVTLNWQERHALLKLRVPTRLTEAVATHEVANGHIERPVDGAEVPSHRWVDVSGHLAAGRAGVALLNDGKYGFDVAAPDGAGADLGMTAARSPIFAWHDPAVPQDGELYRYQDQGEQRFTYRVVPHAGDRRAAGLVRTAAVLNERPTVVFESAHPGPLPTTASFAACESESVLLTVVKAAEDDPDALTLRAHESAGRPAEAVIRITSSGRRIRLTLAPHQMITLLVPADPDEPVRPVDLLERSPAGDPLPDSLGSGPPEWFPAAPAAPADPA